MRWCCFIIARNRGRETILTLLGEAARISCCWPCHWQDLYSPYPLNKVATHGLQMKTQQLSEGERCEYGWGLLLNEALLEHGGKRAVR